jgi:hypothetical protein
MSVIVGEPPPPATERNYDAITRFRAMEGMVRPPSPLGVELPDNPSATFRAALADLALASPGALDALVAQQQNSLPQASGATAIPPQTDTGLQPPPGVGSGTPPPGRQPMPMMPTGQPGTSMEPLSPTDWMRKFFPKLAGKPMLPRRTNEALAQQYHVYLQHQEAKRRGEDTAGANVPAMIVRLIQSGQWDKIPPAMQDRIEKLAERRAAMERGVTPENQVKAAAIDDLRKAGRSNMDILKELQGVTGSARPEGAEAGLKRKAIEELGRGGKPATEVLGTYRNLGQAEKPGASLIPRSEVSKKLFGSGSLDKGLVDAAVPDPAKPAKDTLGGWSNLFDYAASTTRYLEPAIAQKLWETVQDTAPSRDQVLAAYQQGRFGSVKGWFGGTNQDAMKKSEALMSRLDALEKALGSSPAGKVPSPSTTGPSTRPVWITGGTAPAIQDEDYEPDAEE